MSQEIIYTSAPQGLRPGSFGFCTVATTPGMAATLAERLESLSGYRHQYPPGHPRAAYNPVVFSHLILKIGGKRYHFLSRVADAGLDYSQRTNKLAHHVALEAGELVSAGPAWALSQPGFAETSWSGPARVLPAGRALPRGEIRRGVCTAWQAACGDAGWAGVLAQHTLTSPRPAHVIFPEGMDCLALLVEAQSLLPAPKRWEVSFSTFFTRLPPGVECQWRCVLAGSPEAQAIAGLRGEFILDLSQALGPAPPGALVEQARTGNLPLEIDDSPPPRGDSVAQAPPPATAAQSILPPSLESDLTLAPPARRTLHSDSPPRPLPASFAARRPGHRQSARLWLSTLAVLMVLGISIGVGGVSAWWYLQQPPPPVIAQAPPVDPPLPPMPPPAVPPAAKQSAPRPNEPMTLTPHPDVPAQPPKEGGHAAGQPGTKPADMPDQPDSASSGGTPMPGPSSEKNGENTPRHTQVPTSPKPAIRRIGSAPDEPVVFLVSNGPMSAGQKKSFKLVRAETAYPPDVKLSIAPPDSHLSMVRESDKYVVKYVVNDGFGSGSEKTVAEVKAEHDGKTFTISFTWTTDPATSRQCRALLRSGLAIESANTDGAPHFVQFTAPFVEKPPTPTHPEYRHKVSISKELAAVLSSCKPNELQLVVDDISNFPQSINMSASSADGLIREYIGDALTQLKFVLGVSTEKKECEASLKLHGEQNATTQATVSLLDAQLKQLGTKDEAVQRARGKVDKAKKEDREAANAELETAKQDRNTFLNENRIGEYKGSGDCREIKEFCEWFNSKAAPEIEFRIVRRIKVGDKEEEITLVHFK